jgi:hypothetical protein
MVITIPEHKNLKFDAVKIPTFTTHSQQRGLKVSLQFDSMTLFTHYPQSTIPIDNMARITNVSLEQKIGTCET